MSSALIILAVVSVGAAWLCSGLLLGQALRYRARLRGAEAEAAAPSYAPRATVIAPCRGVDAAFEATILALLRQDYPAYEVIFVTGTSDEPAHARLTQILARGGGRGRLTVAGPAAGRSQKVHNQLHALRLADATSEVFVFVDSDGRPGERFLRHLVDPLADARVGAATGYRWFAPPRRGMLAILAALWGGVVASAQADPQFAQLWGGAMAIRREHFAALAVAQAWAGASTDDDALTRIVRRAGLRIAFVPQCYVLSTSAGSPREFMTWGMRQLLFMRVYLAGMWRLGFAMTAVTALAPAAGLALILAAAASARGLLIWGLLLLSAGLGSVVSSACVVRSTERLQDTLGAAIPRLGWPDFLAYLPGAWVFLAHFIQSAVTRRVAWQGVTYELLGPERTVLVDGARTPGARTPGAAVGAAATAEIIRIRGLSKRYGPAKALALDDIHLDIRAGEIFSLLGPNGAGKTSLIGVLCGLLSPTAGDAWVGGHSVVREPMAVKQIIGVVPEEIALYPQLSARRNLRYFGALYGLNGAAREQAVSAALAAVGLTAQADERVDRYSNGMKRRLNIAAGLLHGPRILLMDEPTLGLDPQSRRAILDLVRRLKEERHVTILYTTHIMAEAEEISDRVGIIHQGRLIAQGAPAELIRTLHAEDTLRLHVDDAARIPAAALDALREADGVRQLTAGVEAVTLTVADAAEALPDILRVARAAGIGVRSLTVEQPSLEAVFLRLTGHSLRETPGSEGRGAG